MNINDFFSTEQKDEIIKAIKSAELMTSGEIRVHLELKCKGNVSKRTIKWFKRLKMHRTLKHNGVLIYLAVQDKQFTIYGDKGINRLVPENFWVDVKAEMQENFVKGRFTAGIIAGIQKAGEKLQEYFPHQKDDVDELPDEISTSSGNS
jgi:uncharacterized membrane protein